MHDPKAQDVIAETFRYMFGLKRVKYAKQRADRFLDLLADAGLVVVSDASEPCLCAINDTFYDPEYGKPRRPQSEVERAREAAEHRQTFS